MNNKQRELLLTAAIIIIAVRINLVTDELFRALPDSFLAGFLNKLFFSAAALLGAVVLKKTWIFRSDPALFRKGWTSGIPELLLLAALLPAVFINCRYITVGGSAIILFALQMLLVGFCEETLFRGLLQNAFHDLLKEDTVGHVILAVVCSGLCFGAVHVTNALKPDITFLAALRQAVAAAASGMMLGSVYFRTGKCLWYVALLHALHDAVTMILNGRLNGVSTEAVIDQASVRGSVDMFFAQTMFYVFIAIFLLRKKQSEPLLKKD